MFIKLHGCAHDLTGRRFSRLVALGPVERIYVVPRGTAVKWLCKCDCGKETIVFAQCLRNKNTKSCGCLNEEKRRARLDAQLTHGLSGSPEFWVWNAAKRRCHSPRDKSYKNYGARGIKMCKRWRDDFGAFIEDMGRRPSDAHTLERLDNNKGYEPSNCAWRTVLVQANNKRNNRRLTAFGRTQTLPQWAREIGIPASALSARLERGWTIEKAITEPSQKKETMVLEAFSKKLTIGQWSKRTGLLRQTIGARLKAGWTPETALSTPVTQIAKAA
jgi:hypothetical protein